MVKINREVEGSTPSQTTSGQPPGGVHTETEDGTNKQNPSRGK